MDAVAPEHPVDHPAMTALHLAWRTVRRYRAQTLLAIAGVAVIGALLFDMLLLSRGLLLSFSDLLERAGYDVRIVGGGGLTLRFPIADSASLARDIAALPEVQRVVSIRLLPAAMQLPAPTRPVDVTLVGVSEAAAGVWTIVRGENLGNDAAGGCPIVVGRQLADRLGLSPGAGVRVIAEPPGVASALPPVDCNVVGIARFAFSAAGTDDVATTIDAFQRAAAESEPGDADLILIASRPDVPRPDVVAAIQRLRPGIGVYSNDDVVEQFNRNGFAYFRQISIVLSSLTMVFVFLLVATLLTVSVNQRLGEIAALRAIGIARRRIAAMLLWESALLVGVGGLLALPLGQVLAVGLDHILRQMPGLPEQLHFFVFEARELVIHLALLVATAFAAAAYPMWLTARMPIAATLRREVVD
ncbi:MAG TPA: FtsX-like permease family protein [Vicinamibacterales bacterium]|nr:FtsX-like permease family protein [Vicinamibacterales bacterium]